jgi:hypothetical protein
LADFPADRNKRIWKNDRGINPGYRTAQQLTQLLAEPNRVASGLRHKALRRSLVPNQQPPLSRADIPSVRLRFETLRSFGRNIARIRGKRGLQDGRLIPRDIQLDSNSPSQMSLFA